MALLAHPSLGIASTGGFLNAVEKRPLPTSPFNSRERALSFKSQKSFIQNKITREGLESSFFFFKEFQSFPIGNIKPQGGL
jgi:hypothetical protein